MDLNEKLKEKKSFTVRMINLIESYKHIVIAQVAISVLNTLMITIFLYIMKTPLIGIEFPFIKTIILLTFIFGLIPIFGNIIVNTIIFIIGLSVSISAGLITLTYLIIIHKYSKHNYFYYWFISFCIFWFNFNYLFNYHS